MNESYEAAKERNEKNKAFRKRLKIYEIGIIVLFGVLFLGLGALKVYDISETTSKIGGFALIAVFVIWLLWLIIGYFKICCPHCNSHIGRSDPWHILKCPYCGTCLEILKCFAREKL